LISCSFQIQLKQAVVSAQGDSLQNIQSVIKAFMLQNKYFATFTGNSNIISRLNKLLNLLSTKIINRNK